MRRLAALAAVASLLAAGALLAVRQPLTPATSVAAAVALPEPRQTPSWRASRERRPAPVPSTLKPMTERRTPVPRGAKRGGVPAEQQHRGGTALRWDRLAKCESGGNPRAVSPTGKYRGLYQFSMTTWRSVGGTGDPIDASAAEQTYRAQILYRRSGRGQWPVCGKLL